jgi:hypothetical protein
MKSGLLLSTFSLVQIFLPMFSGSINNWAIDERQIKRLTSSNKANHGEQHRRIEVLNGVFDSLCHINHQA